MVNDEIMKNKDAWIMVEGAMYQSKRWVDLNDAQRKAAMRVGISNTEWDDPDLIGSGGWEQVQAKKAAGVAAAAAVTAQLNKYTPYQMGLSTQPSFSDLYENFKKSIGCPAVASVSTVCDGLKKRAIENANDTWRSFSHPIESSAALLGSITSYFYSMTPIS
jgi:hypothetical protein